MRRRHLDPKGIPEQTVILGQTNPAANYKTPGSCVHKPGIFYSLSSRILRFRVIRIQLRLRSGTRDAIHLKVIVFLKRLHRRDGIRAVIPGHFVEVAQFLQLLLERLHRVAFILMLQHRDRRTGRFAVRTVRALRAGVFARARTRIM